MPDLLHLTKADFEKEVLNSLAPVVVDFWAEWCPPCRMIAPLLDQLADEYNGKVKFVKVNVDEEPELATEYNVMNIPTLIFFKDGIPQEKIVGAVPKQKIKDVINGLLG